jgi:hypothetical protein
LNVVLVGDVERANDDRERRQNGVDGYRLGRHHRRRQRHEFGKADPDGLALVRHRC